MQGALPPGWVWTTLQTVAAQEQNAIVDGPFGSNLKVSDYIEGNNGVPVLTTRNLNGDYTPNAVRYISQEKFSALKRSAVKGGDILVAKIGSCGKTGMYPSNMPTAIIPANLLKMTVNREFPMRYVYYYLNSPVFQNKLREITTATAQPAFNVSKFRLLKIPVAPLAEQRRIVAKIEELLTRLDAGVAALKRAQANLKRYKASVLKAACEGKLVPIEADLARAEGRTYEPADELLKRILSERRAKWEADLRAKGKDPSKVKYVEPQPPDTSGLPELPEGWCWASVEQLAYKVVDGVHKKPNYVQQGIPFVTIRNLTSGPSIDFNNLNHISLSDHLEFCKRANPECGDILISKDGTLGVIRVVDTDQQFSIFVSVALIKPNIKPMSSYLGLALSSPQVQIQMVPKGSGLPHIHLEDLRQDCVPLPPFTEQKRIVTEIDRHLSVLTQIETSIVDNLARAERLRQSILRRAFSGKLVPQDPGDESAGALLERIRNADTKPASRQSSMLDAAP